ncbi:right-handed parallel beta-helix repeat-containing protein [Arthrobacter alpinus]|uniref:right-handed parallel beta-helix repeat-containing protein n=1 Tax=Arthrobacter alpinus TaxID=656366 RepID=UPI0016467675|nr:right-handed parallel beta-helix repeat-containing protein [Arthrobacter alpinus]
MTRQFFRASKKHVLSSITASLAVGFALSSGGIADAAVLNSTSPTAARIIASDSFDRPDSQNWGAAELGGAYVSSDRQGISVSAGHGVMDLPAAGLSREAELSSVSQADVLTTANLKLTKFPTRGSGSTFAIQTRKKDGYAYLATIRVQPNGQAYLSIVRIDGTPGATTTIGGQTLLPMTVMPGVPFNLQIEVTGTSTVALRARAWANGADTPGWQTTAEDSSGKRVTNAGGAGLWAYTSQSSSAATYAIDDWSVVAASPELPPVTPPAPTVTPPTPPVTSPPDTTQPAQSTISSGSLPVGSARYDVPADAIFVSAQGNDAAKGTQSSPLATVRQAVDMVPAGGTIVVRAGTYNETVVLPNYKKISLQNYPGEAVWFDGSIPVDNWQTSGQNWVSDNWTAKFDSSPTDVRGAPDNVAENWQYLNAAHPMAAHPDQLFIDGASMIQVASLDQVAIGKFYVDYSQNRVYSGTNPAGREVRASTLQKAFVVTSPGGSVRGIGIRRYAPSVPDMGAVYINPNGAGVQFENVVVTDNATTGLSVNAANVSLKNVTSSNNGFLGMQSTAADNLTIDAVKVENNNTEHFNATPAAGGYKIGRSRGVKVSNSNFTGNDGNGLWFDESVYDMTVVNSIFNANTVHGLQIELSAKAIVANNSFTNNGVDGLEIQGSGDIQIWNNTFTGNAARAIYLIQDPRRASNLATPGHDPRQNNPDSTIPWLTQDIVISNNVLTGSAGGGNCLLCVTDQARTLTAEAMRLKVQGNAWNRPTVNSPLTMVSWAAGGAGSTKFASLSSFQQATGQESSGAESSGSTVVLPVGQVVPSEISNVTGLAAGTRMVGAAERK